MKNIVVMAVAAVMNMALLAVPTNASGRRGTCPVGSANTTYENSIAECNLQASGATSLWTTINTIINVALGMIGLVAVIFIIYGGFQYTTSAGDASKVKKAKDTIVNGVIGLVIALLAFAIVNFVLDGIFGGKTA